MVPTPSGALSTAPRASAWSCWRIVTVAVLIVVSHVLYLCVIQGKPSLVEAYLDLRQFDTDWYCHIMTQGYRSTIPPVAQDKDLANVAFFPGYPLSAQALYQGLGLNETVALLLASQLAACGYWAYVLLFLKRWQVPRDLAVGGLILLATHPAAFFLAAGYSESLFLFALLGFLYWGNTAGWRAWGLAALHGFVMSATRLVGLGMVILPLLHLAATSLFRPRGQQAGGEACRSRLLAAALLAGVASLGGLSFFAYCHWRFGCWNLYMLTGQVGWGLTPDYLALFRSRWYGLYLPDFSSLGWPHTLSPLSVPLTVFLGLGILLVEARLAPLLPPGNWRERAYLYFGATIQFFISASGKANDSMSSMLRYNYPVHLLLLLAVLHLATTWRQTAPHSAKARSWPLRFAWAVLVVGFLVLQTALLRIFADGRWVA